MINYVLVDEEKAAFLSSGMHLKAFSCWAVWNIHCVPAHAVLLGGFADRAKRDAAWVGFGYTHADAFIDYLGKMGQV